MHRQITLDTVQSPEYCSLSDYLGGEFVITPVVMPQLGLEVTEGTVATIHVAVGERVAEGDPLLELETDKALTDVVAPRAAVVRSVEVQIGDTVALGSTLVVLADEVGEAIGATMSGSDTMPSVADARVRAAPVARRAAVQLGVALGDVPGTGPRGRITLKDVERAAGAQL